MRQTIRIALLAVGTVLGYGFAFRSMRHHRCEHDAWEHHVDDVRVGAARTVKGERRAAPEKVPPPTESPEP